VISGFPFGRKMLKTQLTRDADVDQSAVENLDLIKPYPAY
jgi:hypothetical protein